MIVKNVLLFMLWIVLSSIALIGGAAEKWWLVLTILLCFMVWVLYLLIKLENREFEISALRSLYDAYTKLKETSERARRLPRQPNARQIRKLT